MPKYTLSKGAQKLISEAIDNLFQKAKIRFLGTPNDKRLMVSVTPDFSLPGLFTAAATGQGVKANTDTLKEIVDIAEMYIDATKERTKAHTLKVISSTLADAKKKKKLPEPMRDILERELTDVWEKAQSQMRTIAEVEAQTAKNMSVLDGILKINAENAIEDPVVYFITVKDRDLCGECKRLHLMPDEQTPRLWYMSEVKHGYHKKGEDSPCMGGLHPHCRCSILTMLPGYSFDKSGHVQFQARGWVEIDYQRGKVATKAPRVVKKSESLDKMAIADIKPGTPLPDDEEYGGWPSHMHDYSHLLSEEHRAQGLALHVRTRINPDKKNGEKGGFSALLRGPKGPLGSVHATVHNDRFGNKGISVGLSDAHPSVRGKGLGQKLYEALYAHAYHNHGARVAVGGIHSTLASRAHQRLSDKHGLDYKAVPTPGGPQRADGEEDPDSRAFDEAFDSYHYALKSEEDDFEPLQKAEWYWKNLKRKFEDYGWEQVEGAKHTKMVNPYIPGEPWVTIKRSHMNGPIDPEAVDAMYAKPMGLRVRHSGTDVDVDPKHPHAAHYKKLGLWDGHPEGPKPVISWTPSALHEHVDMAHIDHAPVPDKDAWKPPMQAKKMKDEPAKVTPVKLRRLEGGERYQVVEGHDKIHAAKLNEYTHVPAEIVK